MEHVVMSLIYVASPYTHPDPEVMASRFRAVRHHVFERITVDRRLNGVNKFFYYSPILYFHELALVYDLPKDALFWEAMDTMQLVYAKELEILMIDGWEDSKGVRTERNLAKKLCIPITHAEPSAEVRALAEGVQPVHLRQRSA